MVAVRPYVAVIFFLLALAAAGTLYLGGRWAERADAGVAVVVTNLGDPGNGNCDASCTLREAIDAANSVPGTDIRFDVPGCPPACTIQPGSDLPAITANSITIDGTTQPGFDGIPLIELNGDLAGASPGLDIEADDVTIRGLVINGFAESGIVINGSDALIVGNFIGTDATGTADAGNGGDGVFIDNHANNTIGGITERERNVISGNNGNGVNIAGAAATGNVVGGNYIGTDVTGDVGIGNGGGGGSFDGNGVRIAGSGNTIGGTAPGAGNLISGSDDVGVFVPSGTFFNNVIQGNRIGTNAAGLAAIPNAGGVHAASGSTTIGGSAAGARNIISGNQFQGIRLDTAGSTGNVVRGNYIGTAIDGISDLGNGAAGIDFTQGSSNNVIGGTLEGEGNVIAFNSRGIAVLSETSDGNRILGNSIHSNTGLGIELMGPAGELGVSPNDDGDLDSGGNNQQNFPVLTSAESGSVEVEGTLSSTVSTSYLVEVFASDECDASGNGEGQRPLGWVVVNLDASGEGGFSFEAFEPIEPGSSITATATSLTTDDTSEFSECIELTGPTPTPTVAPTPTATPTPTPTPTGGVTPSSSPTSTPTPTPLGRIQGDVNCDGNVTSIDALGILRFVAHLSPLAQQDPCPDIGANSGGVFGDIDCKEGVTSVDALGILRFVALLDPLAQQEPCTDIGDTPATGT
jgi:CSLREA domain-containing protein